jgi:dipeptidyl-peptidase-4
MDFLVSNGVSPEKMTWTAFADSDHSIAYHGVSTWLYRFLTKCLYDEKVRIVGETEKHQWSRKRDGVVKAMFVFE